MRSRLRWPRPCWLSEWDPGAAAFAIEFFGYLVHSKGEWAGKPFVLSPFQEFIVGNLFGPIFGNQPNFNTLRGDKPRWRRDGKELDYIALDGKMMAVPVKSTATTFEPGVAVSLFETHATGFIPYDVAPDGRFLINTVTDDAAASASPITVVLNWTAGLKK